MKTRLILLVIVTLIIGFTLGMLTSAQLRLQKLKPVRFYYSEDRFREGFYKTIQPDEKQKAKIDLILDKYAKINSDTQSKFRKEFDSNIKAMRKELDSNLTKEQLERVKEMDERRQEMIRQDRRRPGNDSSDFRDGRRHHPDQGQRPGGPPPPPFTEGDSASLPD